MKKVAIVTAILVFVILFGLWAFLFMGRAGGEVGFKATVTQVEYGKVYATVLEDDAGFGSRKLPKSIVINTEDFPEYEFEVSDLIDGVYIRKNHEGSFYRVVSIVVHGK